MLLHFLLLIVSPLSALATLGVDVSQSVTQAQFDCLKKNGHEFAIVRAFQSTGVVDPNGAQTIKNARAAGIPYVDGYLFPCLSCGNAAEQVSATMDHLEAQGAEIGMLWFDVEGADDYWNDDSNANVQFIQALIDAAKEREIKFGIYTSKSQWDPITGGTSQFGDEPPLWYAHYDDDASFNDFQPFGGWKSPAIKQFAGDVTECGVGIDKNFY